MDQFDVIYKVNLRSFDRDSQQFDKGHKILLKTTFARINPRV